MLITILTIFIGLIFFSGFGSIINSKARWLFPFSLCWSFSLFSFLLGFLILDSRAIKQSLLERKKVSIDYLYASQMNLIDYVLLGLIGAIFIYGFFVWVNALFESRTKSPLINHRWINEPFNAFDGMGFWESIRYYCAFTLLCSFGGVLGFVVGQFF